MPYALHRFPPMFGLKKHPIQKPGDRRVRRAVRLQPHQVQARLQHIRGEIEDEGSDRDELDHDDYVPGDMLELVGFDLGGFLHGIVHDLKRVASVVGPVIATVYPPAGVAIAGGVAILNAVDKDDPEAKQKVADTKAAAAAGDTKAQDTMHLLDVARMVIDKTNSPAGQALLQAAQAAKVVGEMAACGELNEETILGMNKARKNAHRVIGAEYVPQDVIDSFNKLRALAKGGAVSGDETVCCCGADMVDEVIGFSLKSAFKKLKKKLNIKKALKSAAHAAESVAKKAEHAAASAAKKIAKAFSPKKAAQSPAARHQVASAVKLIQVIKAGGKPAKQALVNVAHLKKGAAGGDKNALAVLNMIKHTNAGLKGEQQIVVGDAEVVIGFSFGDIVNAVMGFVADVINDPIKYIFPVVGPIVRDLAEGKPVDLVEVFLPGVKSTLGIPPQAGSGEAKHQGLEDQGGDQGGDQPADDGSGAPADDGSGAPADDGSGAPADDGGDGGAQAGPVGPSRGKVRVSRPGGARGAAPAPDDGGGDDGGDGGGDDYSQEDDAMQARRDADRQARAFEASMDDGGGDDGGDDAGGVEGDELEPGANEQLQDVLADAETGDMQ